MDHPNTPPRGIVVFSGGSAANHLVDVFNRVIEAKDCALSYVIPISDNGGSSSELIRVFGGPGIGDVRSRLVRLIPDNGQDPERSAIKAFFNYRLPLDPQAARIEWLDIVEARHELWTVISSPKKELIRSFLNLLNLEIVKRARPSSVFNFQSASVGNLFLTGARLFSGSFESAIYLLSSICTIPHNIAVLPAINTNFSHHICAGLANGETIPGQNAISHPSEPTALPSTYGTPLRPLTPSLQNADTTHTYFDPHLLSPTTTRLETETADTIEDANLPGSLPTLRKPYLAFTKSLTTTTTAGHPHSTDLPARISRVWYINPYGQEIRPSCNPKILDAIASARCIIYSIGSLYTSIIPSLILRGVGDALARKPAASCPKILLLNGSLDRETGPAAAPFSAEDFVLAVARAGLESRGVFGREAVPGEVREFVTHLVYVEGEGTPRVRKEVLAGWGIECVRVYGRKAEGGGGCRYDETALVQTLEALVGRREGRDGKRRYTLER